MLKFLKKLRSCVSLCEGTEPEDIRSKSIISTNSPQPLIPAKVTNSKTGGEWLIFLLQNKKFTEAEGLLRQWNPIDLSCTDLSRNTALHLALINKQENLAKLLLLRDAKADLRNVYKETPLDIAGAQGLENFIGYYCNLLSVGKIASSHAQQSRKFFVEERSKEFQEQVEHEPYYEQGKSQTYWVRAVTVKIYQLLPTNGYAITYCPTCFFIDYPACPTIIESIGEDAITSDN